MNASCSVRIIDDLQVIAKASVLNNYKHEAKIEWNGVPRKQFILNISGPAMIKFQPYILLPRKKATFEKVFRLTDIRQMTSIKREKSPRTVRRLKVEGGLIQLANRHIVFA